MKVTIKVLMEAQKVIAEVMKYPMKWKTATVFNDFLKEIDQILRNTISESGIQDKEAKLADQMAEEAKKVLEANESYKKLSDKEKFDAFNNLMRDENFKNESEANKEYMKLLEEFYATEVESPQCAYVLDETLPAMFNIWMKGEVLPMIKFKMRDTKKA